MVFFASRARKHRVFEMRLICFLFSVSSHCEIIPTVASFSVHISPEKTLNILLLTFLLASEILKIEDFFLKYKIEMFLGNEHLSWIPSKMFFVCLYSIHECLFMRKFMLYIWYLSNNRRFIKWDFPTGDVRGNFEGFHLNKNIPGH